MKVLIYGLGRMGLTHYAILNQILPSAEFTFIEPNNFVSFFSRSNIKATIVKSRNELKYPFDYVLVCTPPMFHNSIVNECIGYGDKHIFIEKPFGGNDDDFSKAIEKKNSINIGYVLRFNPIVDWVRSFISDKEVKSVYGEYLSNTIQKKPTGWRNGSYSGVLNEMGSHILDLAVYFFQLQNPLVLSKNVSSVVSDVEDIVDMKLREFGKDFHFYFNWVDPRFRKPVFKIKISFEDDSFIEFDQQKVTYIKDGIIVFSKSVVDIADSIPFYLRGIDFTNQMKSFVENSGTCCTVDEALVTRNIIKQVLKK